MLILVCEDNKKELHSCVLALEALCKTYDNSVGVRGYQSADEMFMHWDDMREDVGAVYLDISMPGTDGISAAKELRNAEFSGEIVFLTAAQDKWEAAFEVDASYYAVKETMKAEKFEKVFLRVLNRAKRRQTEYMTFSCAGEYATVRVEDILYFEVNARIVTVFYQDKSFEFYTQMGKLEERLKNYGFVRIHRSYLVAKSAIRSATGGSVELYNGQKLPMGRYYASQIRSMLKGS